MTATEPQQDGTNPRKKLYSALVGNANPEAKSHFKQFSFEQFNKRLDDEKFVEDLYQSLRDNDVVLDAKNRQPEQNYYDFLDAYVKAKPAAPAAKPAVAPVAEKAKPLETNGKNYDFVGQPQTGEMDAVVVNGKSMAVPKGMTMVPEGEEISEVEYEGKMLPEVTAYGNLPEYGTQEYEQIIKGNYPVGSDEYNLQMAVKNQVPRVELGAGGYTQDMAANLPETMEKAKQSSLSPVFKDYEVAQKMMKGEVPLVTQKDVREAQEGFGRATKEQQQAAIMGTPGYNLEKEKEWEKLSGLEKTGQKVMDFASGFNRALFKTPSSVVKTSSELGVGILNMLGGDMKSEDAILYNLADKYDKWLDTSETAKKWIGDPSRGGLVSDVGSGIGQIFTMYATGGTGGASKALLSQPTVLKAVGQKMFSKPSMVSFSQIFNSEYEAMKAKGESDQTAFKQALLNGFTASPLENLPLVNLAERLNKTIGVKLTKRIINSLQQGAEEATQESVQQVFSNLSNNSLVELEKNIVDWARGVQPSAEAGGVVGALIGGLANVRDARKYATSKVGLSTFSPNIQESPVVRIAANNYQKDISRAEEQGKKPDKFDVKQLEKLRNDPEAWVKGEIKYLTQKIEEDKKANIDTKVTEADLAEHNALLAQIKAEKKAMEQAALAPAQEAAPVTPEAEVVPAETVTAPEVVAPEAPVTETAPVTEEVPVAEETIPVAPETEEDYSFLEETELTPEERDALLAQEETAPVAPAEEEVVTEEVPAEEVVVPEVAPEVAPVEEAAPVAPAAPMKEVGVGGIIRGHEDIVGNEGLGDVRNQLSEENKGVIVANGKDGNQYAVAFSRKGGDRQNIWEQGSSTPRPGHIYTSVKIDDPSNAQEVEAAKKQAEAALAEILPTVKGGNIRASDVQQAITDFQTKKPAEAAPVTPAPAAPAPKGRKKKEAPVTPTPAAPKKEETPKPEPKKEEPKKEQPSSATPQEGDTVEIPAQRAEFGTRKMVFKAGEWKQNVGGDIVKVGPAVQQQAQEAFAGKAEVKTAAETKEGKKAEAKEEKVTPTSETLKGVIGRDVLPETNANVTAIQKKLNDAKSERTQYLLSGKRSFAVDEKLKDKIGELEKQLSKEKDKLAKTRKENLEKMIDNGQLKEAIDNNLITADEARLQVIGNGIMVPNWLQDIVDKAKEKKETSTESIFSRTTDFLGDDKAEFMIPKTDESVRDKETIEYLKGHVKRAIDSGKYEKAIGDGRMTINDAKTIIESYGLKTPKTIEDLAQPSTPSFTSEQSSAKDLASQIEDMRSLPPAKRKAAQQALEERYGKEDVAKMIEITANFTKIIDDLEQRGVVKIDCP